MAAVVESYRQHATWRVQHRSTDRQQLASPPSLCVPVAPDSCDAAAAAFGGAAANEIANCCALLVAVVATVSATHLVAS